MYYQEKKVRGERVKKRTEIYVFFAMLLRFSSVFFNTEKQTNVKKKEIKFIISFSCNIFLFVFVFVFYKEIYGNYIA